MRKFGIIISALIIAAIAVILLFLAPRKDRRGPEINVPGNISYYSGISDVELLQGVTATDKRDGDVSDTLIVTSVLKISGENAVKITYAAQDRSNNITEISVVVSYEGDIEEPEPDTTDSEGDDGDGNTEDGSTEENTENPDGDADTSEENTEDEDTDNEDDENTVGDGNTPDADSEDGNSASDINTNPEAPVLTLTNSEVTITRGTRVNWVNYVADITDDVDDRSSLFRSIIVDNAPDTNNTGDYQVTIYCLDSDGNASARQTLTVHIVE